MVFKNISSRNWKSKSRIFLLIKTMRVASTSISNCCLIFGNVSSSESTRTIFDFPVILELVQLLVGLWFFDLLLIIVLCSKTLIFLDLFLCNPYHQLHEIESVIFRFKFFNFSFNFLVLTLILCNCYHMFYVNLCKVILMVNYTSTNFTWTILDCFVLCLISESTWFQRLKKIKDKFKNLLKCTFPFVSFWVRCILCCCDLHLIPWTCFSE